MFLRFCTWKMERGAKSQADQVPYKPGTNMKAQTNNPDTFSDFTDAMKAYAMGGYDGIGIL
jgi:primase-polymerase (primpol)-like protein